MRFVSIKILVLCILLPPVLYLLTVMVMERQGEERLTRQIEEVYTGDPQRLLDGSLRLENALEANINRYLAASFLARHGFAVRVSVATRAGKLLYPSSLDPPEPGARRPRPPAGGRRKLRAAERGADGARGGAPRAQPPHLQCRPRRLRAGGARRPAAALPRGRPPDEPDGARAARRARPLCPSASGRAPPGSPTCSRSASGCGWSSSA